MDEQCSHVGILATIWYKMYFCTFLVWQVLFLLASITRVFSLPVLGFIIFVKSNHKLLIYIYIDCLQHFTKIIRAEIVSAQMIYIVKKGAVVVTGPGEGRKGVGPRTQSGGPAAFVM